MFEQKYTINKSLTIIKAKIRKIELKIIKKNNLKISEIELNYLVWTVEKNDIPLIKLAKILGVERSTLSNNIKSLLNKGLINKRKRTEGSKFVIITPTEKGKEYIKVYHKIRKAIMTKMNTILEPHEIESFWQIGMKIKNKF